jgi:5-methylthioadenosine/S-adenosylhomocysteine deaminase
MRAALGMIAIEFPTRYAADANDYIAKGLAVRDRHSDAARISFCLAPHAPYTVADKTFEKSPPWPRSSKYRSTCTCTRRRTK